MAHLTAISTGNLSLDARLYAADSISSSESSSNASLGGSAPPGGGPGPSRLGAARGTQSSSPSQGIQIVTPGSYSPVSSSLLGTPMTSQSTLDCGSPSSASDMVLGGGSKLAGLHEWLTGENSRVRSWWAARSGTDLHRLYVAQVQDTDGESCTASMSYRCRTRTVSQSHECTQASCTYFM